MTESVWDYPRPPRVEASGRRIRIDAGGRTIVDTTSAMRVLETSHPPVYYIPSDAVAAGVLEPNPRRTYCEFKGVAHYWDVVIDGRRLDAAAWSYPQPSEGYESITDHTAFYPSRVDACFVDDERVVPQEGDFYGGWITSDVTGPFKGGPGTTGW
jgi:uncharacterized protein (DUF427 family)